jgi:hypothetical protein
MLRPDPRNARTHSKRQINQIVASVREFGFINPILADPEGRVIAGHGRLMAAKAMGLSEVPTIYIHGLSEAQKRALRIADNKIALGAGWDIDILKSELVELGSLDLEFDLSVTGFSTGELEIILNGRSDRDDDVPKAPASPRTRHGDIWILGEHRVGCGDPHDVDFVRRLVGEDAFVDAAFLDPPYDVRSSVRAAPAARDGELAMASGGTNEPEFRAFLQRTLEVSAAMSRDGAVHFVCTDWRHIDDLSAAGKAVYGELLNVCVWNKSKAGTGSLYRSKHELVFVFRVGNVPHFNAAELNKHGRNRADVWDYPCVNSFTGSHGADLGVHRTLKPSALVADAIKDVTLPSDFVLDLFLGSGTTLVAAERVGRRLRGLDIEPAMVDIAIERWTRMTGNAPQLVEGSCA